MERSLNEVETILRTRICGVCSDRKMDGSCGLEQPADCALFRLLPLAAEAIRSTHSDDIRDYVRAIRERVCSICKDQAADGSCEQRNQVRCALDAYLLLVIDAIEESTGRKFDRTFSSVPEKPIIPLAAH